MDAIKKVLIEVVIKESKDISLIDLEKASLLIDKRKQRCMTRDSAVAEETLILTTLKRRIRK